MTIDCDHCVYIKMRNWIINYKFPPGYHLRITPLADELKLSATPVREALIRLANDDFIDFKSSKGFFVKVPTESHIRNQYELIELSMRFMYEIACDDARRSGHIARCLSEITDEFVQRSDPRKYLDLLLGRLYIALGSCSRNSDITRIFFDAVDRTFYFREVECSLRPCPEADIELIQRTLKTLNRGDKGGVQDILRQQVQSRIRSIPMAFDRMMQRLSA